MDFIKSWTLTIVTAAVIGSLIVTLTPSGSMEKTVRTVVSLFLLVSFFLPFVKENNSGLIAEGNQPLFESAPEFDHNELMSDMVQNEVRRLIAEVLDSHSVKYTEINVDISVSENEMIADKVTVVTQEKIKNTDILIKEIKEKTGLIVGIEVRDN